MEKNETNGYNLAHFFLSNAISRPPVMNVAIANYSNYIWALANILRNIHLMKLKIRLRFLPCDSVPFCGASAWVYRWLSLRPALSMESGEMCQNSISILTCFNHTVISCSRST